METGTDTQEASEPFLQELIARIVDSDQSALGLLYDHFATQVYGLAFRITQRVSLAEEVVQDSFWQIWRQAPRFDPQRGSVKSWILTITRSRALDALRRIDPAEHELEDNDLDAIEAPNKDSPPDLLVAVQQKQHLQAALSALDPLPRQLLSLAFFRGLSHDEIAQTSGLPLGTVKSHIRRALQTLQQQLAMNSV